MISVIICSIDNEKFAAVTANYSALLVDTPHEIIPIHDAESLAEGYNRGITQSIGDILVFSHDDIEILTPEFAKKLRNYLTVYDVVGIAGTTCLVDAKWLAAGHPHIHGNVTHQVPSGQFEISVYGARTTVVKHIQALDGVLIAARRNVLETIKFDQDTFDGFHCYDVDFTFSCYRHGFKLAVCNDLTLIHQSGGRFDARWEAYRDRFVSKHEAALGKRPKQDCFLASMRADCREDVLKQCAPEILHSAYRLRKA